MSEHTKGPWSAEFYSGTEDFYKDDWVIKDASGGEMMGHTPYYPWVTTNPADVTLIAAAPEMLEALEWAAEWAQESEAGRGDEWWAGLDRVKAAISKAKGKTEGINSTNKVD